MKNNKKQYLHYPHLASVPRLASHTCRQTQLGLRLDCPGAQEPGRVPRTRPPLDLHCPVQLSGSTMTDPSEATHRAITSSHSQTTIKEKPFTGEDTGIWKFSPALTIYDRQDTEVAQIFVTSEASGGRSQTTGPLGFFLTRGIPHCISERQASCRLLWPLKELEGWGARVVVENAAVLPPCGHTS